MPPSDRRLAWWTVLLAMAMAVLATTASALFALNGLRERAEFEDRVDDLEGALQASQGEQQCRAEAFADVQDALQSAQGSAFEVLIETADQFYRVLRNETPEPGRLQQRVVWARDSLADARGAIITYQLTVEGCD